MTSRLHRAGVRRLIALHPECRRMELFDLLGAPELTGLPVAELGPRMAAYVLDPSGRPLRGDPPWLERCLVATPLAPGWATIADDIAAILAGGALAYDDRLLSRRFAPRADEAIAAATFALEPDAARRAIIDLARNAGPDEGLLHLALLQAGLAVAWRPDLAETDGAAEIIDKLLALVDRKSPRPLLDAVGPIIGAIAVEVPRVGDAVMKKLLDTREQMTDRRYGGDSFLGEFHALDRERKMPDEDYYVTLPDRHVVEACAKILGRAAEALDRDGFVALQRAVLDGEVGESLMPHLVGGLISAAAIGPLGQLVAYLMSTRDAEPRALALDIAAQIPLDEISGSVIDALSDDRRELRIKAIGAAKMLTREVSVPALLARLDDPEPAVCAAAAQALVDLGQRAAIDLRRMPGEISIGRSRERAAAARAAIGDTSGPVVAPLLAIALEEAEHDSDSPIVDALGAALGRTSEGISLAAEIIAELPDALPVIALVLTGESVSLDEEIRAPLERVLDPLIASGEDMGMVALLLLSRYSLGDSALHDRIVALAAEREGYAGQLLEALANVGCRSAAAGSLVAGIIADREHLAGALTAAAIAGVVMPFDHPGWEEIRDLLGLGTVASAIAHQALVSRARVRANE